MIPISPDRLIVYTPWYESYWLWFYISHLAARRLAKWLIAREHQRFSSAIKLPDVAALKRARERRIQQFEAEHAAYEKELDDYFRRLMGK